MNLRPLGARVLIKPDDPVDETESGLVLVEHKKPEQTGTVVSVGHPVHPRKHEACWVANELATIEGAAIHADFIRSLVARESCVKAGDNVLFSWAAGQEIFLHDSDERFLLLHEDDLIAVLEDP